VAAGPTSIERRLLILRTFTADSRVRSTVRRLLRNKKVQILLNGGFGLGLLAVAFVSARHFMHGGWPLHHADPILVGAAAALFLIAYAFKAWGWQRLFAPHDRPTAGAASTTRSASPASESSPAPAPGSARSASA
jgi:hypothetical protein